MRVTLKPYVDLSRLSQPERTARSRFELDSAVRSMQHSSIAGARPYRLVVTQGQFHAGPAWYWNFWHREEAARGLDASEDLFLAGHLQPPILRPRSRYFSSPPPRAADPNAGEATY